MSARRRKRRIWQPHANRWARDTGVRPRAYGVILAIAAAALIFFGAAFHRQRVFNYDQPVDNPLVRSLPGYPDTLYSLYEPGTLSEFTIANDMAVGGIERLPSRLLRRTYSPEDRPEACPT